MTEELHSPTDPATPPQTPYSGLTPDVVLDAVASLGLYPDGRLLTLNSYENRVYQVWLDDAPTVVAKFYRPGRWTDEAIAEEHAFTQALHDDGIPVVAPMVFEGRTLLSFQGFRFALFKRQGGRAPELDRPDVLEWMGRLMGRIHAVGGRAEASASTVFAHRPFINAQTFGFAPRDDLLARGCIPDDLLPAWTAAVNLALEGVQACYGRAGDVKLIRLHGDCHAGNVLWTDDGPHFVDFDDARSGPAIQDLWMLLSGDRSEMSRQLDIVLDGYEQFCEFDMRQLHLIEALRTLRLVHYSAWIAQRWSDPAFPVAFPWFNTQRYWQDRILELREQVALMQEEPLRLWR